MKCSVNLKYAGVHGTRMRWEWLVAACMRGEKMAEPGDLSLNRAGHERATKEPESTAEAEKKKRRYPLLPMIILMIVTVGQRCYLATSSQLQLSISLSLSLSLSAAMPLQACKPC